MNKPNTTKEEFGFSVGGPIIKDRLHFFADVERVQLNEGRTIQIPARPELNYSTFTQTRVWDTVYRFDHQLSASYSWDGRWVNDDLFVLLSAKSAAAIFWRSNESIASRVTSSSDPTTSDRETITTGY